MPRTQRLYLRLVNPSLPKPRRRRRPLPCTPAGDRRRITVTLPAELTDQLDSSARRNHRTRSAEAWEAIARYLDNQSHQGTA